MRATPEVSSQTPRRHWRHVRRLWHFPTASGHGQSTALGAQRCQSTESCAQKGSMPVAPSWRSNGGVGTLEKGGHPKTIIVIIMIIIVPPPTIFAMLLIPFVLFIRASRFHLWTTQNEHVILIAVWVPRIITRHVGNTAQGLLLPP